MGTKTTSKDGTPDVPVLESDQLSQTEPGMGRRWSRDQYPGALCFNLLAFVLPAVYATLSKLWVANIDPSMIATAETYTYITTAGEVINEGLPRAAYKVIGDKTRRKRTERVGIALAMIAFQAALGLFLSTIICGAAERFADGYVPVEVRARSVTYVRIAAFSTFFSAIDVAVSTSTRALDRPDVPLLISSVKTALNIVLDLLFLSTVRITRNADVNTQVIIRLACDAAGAIAGLAYFLILVRRKRDRAPWHAAAYLRGLFAIAKPGAYTFAESAVRNGFYLWLVSGIVSLGSDYGTAWAIFNTIRWGLVMVPVYALEATSSTFVGHAWGAFRARFAGTQPGWADIRRLARPAVISVGIALLVEVPLCLFMSFAACYPFALYLSRTPAVADITAHMWRSIDWCYICYAVTTQLATLLLATRPQWYFAQSLAVNLLWVMPWAIVVQVHGLRSGNPWFWHAMVFGGSMVVNFMVILFVVALWANRLRRPRHQRTPVSPPAR